MRHPLATVGRMSASIQNQALSALLFLYRQVLGGDVGNLEGVVRARQPKRLPVVFTVAEVRVRAVLQQLKGTEHSWRSCFTAAVCGSWKPCGFGSRMWISKPGN